MKKIGLLIVSALLFSCDKSTQYHSIQGFTQGTTYHIKYSGNENYKIEIDSLLAVFDTSLSNYNTQSFISKVNTVEKIAVKDSLFLSFFAISKEVYEASEGAFDVSIAPLANAWRFGFKNDSLLPDSAKVDSLLKLIGFDKLVLHNDTLIKTAASITLISNAVAQGMSVDYIASFLESKGVEHYLVEIGGELKAKGLNGESQIWKIGIDVPKENNTGRELQTRLYLNNKSLATSGNYRKFYEQDGKKYSHTINPITGYPVTHNLLSATIVAPTCGYADAFATACMVLGVEKSKALLSNHPELEGYLIFEHEGRLDTWMSPSFADAIIKE